MNIHYVGMSDPDQPSVDHFKAEYLFFMKFLAFFDQLD